MSRLVLFCLLALQAFGAGAVEPESSEFSESSAEDVKFAEGLDRRLQRCLAVLPELGELGPASDLPDVAWLPVAKVRQFGTRRRPADTCRAEAMDVVWDEGGAEEVAAAVTTCLLNHYQHVLAAGVGDLDGRALAVALKKSLACVAAELGQRR